MRLGVGLYEPDHLLCVSKACGVCWEKLGVAMHTGRETIVEKAGLEVFKPLFRNPVKEDEGVPAHLDPPVSEGGV